MGKVLSFRFQQCFHPFATLLVEGFSQMGLFQPQFPSQGSINMVKVLSLSLEQCFGTFTMLLVEESSQTLLFKHLSNHVFRSPQIQKYMSYEGHRFFENVQNSV